MIEAFLTSSVLILAVLVLRRLCRGKISLCLQYGIWLLVAVKLLLVPVPFWESPFSILNLISVESGGVEERENLGMVPGTDTNTETTYVYNNADSNGVYIGEESVVETYFGPTAESTEKVHSFIPEEANGSGRSDKETGFFRDFLNMFPFLVYMNAFLLAAWMFFYNIKFYLKLRNIRVPFENEEQEKGSKKPKIYLVEELKTPCLYGMSIYLPVDTPKDEKKLRHILAHEEAHYRHKDFIWSLLRLICMALNWYNPFVWIAAAAQRQDCELACDEAAIKALGEEERISYGETLIRFVGEKAPQDILTVSTTMTADKKELKTRISCIAKKPATAKSIAAVVCIVLMAAVFCTFTGKVQAAEKTEQTREAAKDVLSDEEPGLPYRQSTETNGEAFTEHIYEPVEGEAMEGVLKGAEEEGRRDFTKEELIEEFSDLIKDSSFSVYVRSVSRSARQIDLFSLPTEIWDHEENPSAYGELVFSEDCSFHLHNFNPEFGRMELYDTDFSGFIDKMSWDGVTEVECKVTCKDGLITDIVGYHTYFGITYSEPVEKRDYYDLHGTEGYHLTGTYLADVSEAEGMEKIYVYSGNMGDGDGGYVVIEKWSDSTSEPEQVLWIEEAHTSRDGWNNIYVGEMDGKAFLFTLSIDIRDGYGSLAYHAFRLDEDGNPLPINGAKYMYEMETYKAENFTQWYASMSAYMNQSFLLLSTQEGTLKTGPGTIYGTQSPGDSSSYTTAPDSMDTTIPAPERGGYELIELKRRIEEGIF